MMLTPIFHIYMIKNYVICFFRLLLTRESLDVQMLVMDVLNQVIKAGREDLENARKKKLRGD